MGMQPTVHLVQMNGNKLKCNIYMNMWGAPLTFYGQAVKRYKYGHCPGIQIWTGYGMYPTMTVDNRLVL